MLRLQLLKAYRDQHTPYSDMWHEHDYVLANAVRTWRISNTLVAVK